jgi:hypothetical protein
MGGSSVEDGCSRLPLASTDVREMFKELIRRDIRNASGAMH